jgi:APA family basic amino acid/polyamine antiporter
MESKSPVSLVRQLGLASATAYVVSNMIGTGIFGATGFLLQDLGTPRNVLIIWVLGAICALAGAWCYSELGVNFPSSGGEYIYLTRAFGPTWGFLSGWISFFAGFSAPIAAAALAFSNYLAYLNPAFKEDAVPVALQLGPVALRLGPGQLLACLLIAVLTVLNLFGIGFISRIQNVLTGTKIGVLLLFIVAAFVGGTGDWSHLSQSVPIQGENLLPAFAVSLYWVYASYSGWNAATYVAEEIAQPARTLPLALTLGTALVAGLYLVLNLVFMYALPLDKMAGEPAVGSVASVYLFGKEAAAVFSVLFAFGLMSTVNAMCTIGPRVYYAMAKNGSFLSAAGYVHPTWRTPVWAILAQGLCAMLMTLTSLRDLLSYIGFTLNFFAACAVASLFWFRRRPGWTKLPVVNFSWPLIPVVFLAIATWSTAYGFWRQPGTAMIALATVACGGLFYKAVVAPRQPTAA